MTADARVVPEIQSRSRAIWRRLVDILRQDFRYALRQLTRSPGFAVVAMLTLAVGIAANVMIFGFANWVMFRPIAGINDPGRLVTFEFQRPRQVLTLPSYPDLDDFRGSVPALQDVAAYNP